MPPMHICDLQPSTNFTFISLRFYYNCRCFKLCMTTLRCLWAQLTRKIAFHIACPWPCDTCFYATKKTHTYDFDKAFTVSLDVFNVAWLLKFIQGL